MNLSTLMAVPLGLFGEVTASAIVPTRHRLRAVPTNARSTLFIPPPYKVSMTRKLLKLIDILPRT
jgi:hypothetical protein